MKKQAFTPHYSKENTSSAIQEQPKTFFEKFRTWFRDFLENAE
ncbi:hypothetical protein KCTC32516_00324 [Polaribacter huanghezhanensis]|nr:hypothetical protein [Polaribacter huanghezhanensis]WKD84987.1 hypothetical protein KCTC32516_00324 [Polaribacter huanghezhanensis]